MTVCVMRDAVHGAKVREGQERARARGVRIGRPPVLTSDLLGRAHVLRAGGMPVREIARTLRVPKTTLHRALRCENKEGMSNA